MSSGGASPRRLVAELMVALAGLAVLAGARGLTMEWLERRFCLDATRTQLWQVERTIVVVVGLVLLFYVRPRVGRWVERVGAGEAIGACVRYGVALVMSLVASELGLRMLKVPPSHDTGALAVSVGEANPRYGWLFKAHTSVTIETGGRPIRYDFDADHNRAPSIDAAVDPTLPTILFVGESITAGHGLPWDESYPALVGEAMHVQVLDLGVEGYAVDQSFVRLADALPRFQHPVAIVTLFLCSVMNRIVRPDHPHLFFDGDAVRLEPPGFVQRLHLTQAMRESFDYLPEWAIQSTAAVFQHTARLAEQHGARAVFVTPYLGVNWPRVDGYLIDQVLTRQGLTVVNPHFGFQGIPYDNHPDAASTRRLADAVIAELRYSEHLPPVGGPQDGPPAPGNARQR